MFHAIFFDMDGVTIDSEPQWHESERELMSEHGYEWQESDQIACLGGPLWRVGEYMARKVDSEKSGAWFTEALIEKQISKMKRGTEVLPGVAPLIASFRSFSIPIALVSASPRSILNAALTGGIHELFDFTISSDDVEKTKPDPEPYLTAARQAGVDIAHSLVIEDSFTGISSGKSAGAYVLAVPHFIDVVEEERLKVASTLVGMTAEKAYSLFIEPLSA